jgi:hypothetical protein
MKSAIFWDVTLCSPAEVIIVLADRFVLDGCLANSSNLRMEAGHSSEISVNFYHAT